MPAAKGTVKFSKHHAQWDMLNVRIEPDLASRLRAAQADALGLVKGLMPSRSLLVRRALQFYLAYLLTLTPDQWKDEAKKREEMSR